MYNIVFWCEANCTGNLPYTTPSWCSKHQCTIHHGFMHYALPLCKLTITALDTSEKERSGQFAPKYVLLTASLEGFVFSIQKIIWFCSMFQACSWWYFYSRSKYLVLLTQCLNCWLPQCHVSNTLIACSLHMSSEGSLGLCVQYPPNHLNLQSA